MATFIDVLYFLLLWLVIVSIVMALYNLVKLSYYYVEKKRFEVKRPQQIDLNLIITYCEYDINETEKICSGVKYGETIPNHEPVEYFYQQDARPYWAPLFDTIITVDDNEDHDMFRNNAGQTQL